MAALTPQEMDIDGVAVTMASAGGSGDTFVNDGKTFFKVTNGSGGSINVTFTTQDTTLNAPGFGDVTVSDKVVAVANGATAYIGFFAKTRFNNASGAVAVSYSGTSSVTVAAIKAPRAEQ